METSTRWGPYRDSIVVAPARPDGPEVQMLRTAAIDIVRELGVEGACNVQYA